MAKIGTWTGGNPPKKMPDPDELKKPTRMPTNAKPKRKRKPGSGAKAKTPPSNQTFYGVKK